jgi:hypothetical protein
MKSIDLGRAEKINKSILEDIFLWFTKEDLVKLSKFSYGIHVYESIDYKWYDRFKHWAIHQKTSNLIKIIEIETVL